MVADPQYISQSELRAAIQAAAERQSRGQDPEAIAMSDAEKIAKEVGISRDEFRAAMRDLRQPSTNERRFFGPPSALSVSELLPLQVTADQAAEMLARGEVALGGTGGSIQPSGVGVWRLPGTDGSVLHVITAREETTLAASVHRGRS